MTMITIELKRGEVTLNLNDILNVRKENESSNLMGDIWPTEYYFTTKEQKYYLTEEQYNSLVQKLTSCS